MLTTTSDLRVFIMAQGIQSRMPNATTRKQLLKVAGQPILARTIGQVRAHSYKPADCPRSVSMEPIVVGWPDMEELVTGQYGCELLTLRWPGLCILDGMHGTDPYWSDGRNIFLLGDVVYTREAIHTILTCQADVMFFGTTNMGQALGELFAFSIADGAVNTTAELLMKVECRYAHSVSNHTKHGQAGHLRNFLWLWMRYLGLRNKSGHEHYADEIYTPISDWTNDIDTDKEVAELLPELDRLAWEERNDVEED